MTNIAGINIDEYCPVCGKCKEWKTQRQLIEQQVRDSAYHIINYKGSTQFAVGLALVRITGAILRSQNTILSVSTLLESEFGINDVCLSVPCVVSDKGIMRIIESPLVSSELKALSNSAAILRKAIDSL
jgi:L-lactate dehydrogenase